MERWVNCTEVRKDETGSYSIEIDTWLNMPCERRMSLYITSSGQNLTHFETDDLDMYMLEPVAHFLP